MSERTLPAGLRTSLLNNEPFIYYNLIKFEKPRPSLPDGATTNKAIDYVHITDAPYNVSWDDGSVNSVGVANGVQNYIANKVIGVGGIQESIEARATTMSIKLSTSALGALASSVAQTTSTYIDTHTDLIAAGFREGDKALVNSSGQSGDKYVRFDRFTQSPTTGLPNSRVYYTNIDTVLATDAGTNSYTFSLASEELIALTQSKEALYYANYINREVYIYRVHASPETGAIQGEPFLLFKGIISNGSIQENPDKESAIIWGLTSHWGDFTRVQGRITSDSSHRALNLGGRSDTDALIRPEYANDYGFAHAEQSINVLAPYQTIEIRYTMKKKSKWFGLSKSYSLVEEQVPVTREVDVRFDLSAKYLPVVYGVQKVSAIPVFADISPNAENTDVFVLHAICEGEIGGVFDIYIDDKSSVCLDEMDAETREINPNATEEQIEEANIDVACFGRMDKGYVLTGNDYLDTPRTGIAYRNPADNNEVLRLRDGIFHGPVWNRNLYTWNNNATPSPVGITHEKTYSFLKPIDMEFIIHTGKADQQADQLILETAEQQKFLVQTTYYSGDPSSYWSPSHRLLDTAYVTGKYTLTEGEETIPETEYVVRGKFIECYNYDSSFRIVSGDPSGYNIGDTVSLAVTGGGSHSNVQIIDKWTMYDRDGNPDVRFRWMTNWPYSQDTLVDLQGGTVITMTGGAGTIIMHAYNHLIITDSSVQTILPVNASSASYTNSAGLGILSITLNNGDPDYAAMHSILNGAGAAITKIQVGLTTIPETSFAVNSYSSGTIFLVPNSSAGKLITDNISGAAVFLSNAIKLSSTTGVVVGSRIEVRRVVDDAILTRKGEVAAISGTVLFAKSAFDPTFLPGLNIGTWAAISPDDKCDVGGQVDERVSINPAMQLLDYMTSKRYGRNLNIEKELHLDTFLESARLCDDRSKVTLVTGTIPTGLTLGAKYRINYPDSKLMFQGTVIATKNADSSQMYATHNGTYQVTFDHVIGKLGYKFSTARTYKAGDFVWIDGVVKVATAGTLTKEAFNLLPAATITLVKISGGGPATIPVSLAYTGVNNPIVKSWSDDDGDYTLPGYSLYDSCDVRYWKYSGWDAQEQRFVTRHQTNQVISTSSPLFDNINGMLAQFNGILRYVNGKYELDIKTGAPSAFTAGIDSISEDDIIGDIKLDDQGQRNCYNTVTANIPDPQNKFANRSITFSNSNYLKEDKGVPKQGNFNMPSITNYYNARLNIVQYLEESRYGLNISFTMDPKGYLLKAGNVIAINYSRFDWVNALFRIETLTLQPNGLVAIVATQHNDKAYLIDYVDRSSADAGGLVGEGQIIPTIEPPFGLVASQDLHGEIELTWQNTASYKAWAHTIEVWAAEASKNTAGEYLPELDSFGDPITDSDGYIIYQGNNIANATLLDWTNGTKYVHDGLGPEPLHVWFYWIRYVIPPLFKRATPLYSPFFPVGLGEQGRAFSGANLSALTLHLSNENHTFPANAAGTITSFVGSGTEVHLFEGSEELVFDPLRLPTDAGTWEFSALTEVDINEPVPETTTLGVYAVIPDFPPSTVMSDDHASVTYEVTGRRASGENIIALSKVQSFSKAKAGADGDQGADGVNAKAVKLTAESYFIKYDENEVNPIFPGSSDGYLTLTANAQGTIANPVFKFTGDGFIDENDFFPGSTADFPNRTFDIAIPANYFQEPWTIQVEVADGDDTNPTTLAYDTISIVATHPGTDGEAGVTGRSVSLSAPTFAVTYNEEGLVPDPASVIITAQSFNTVEPPWFTFYVDDVEVLSVAGDSSNSAQYTYIPQTDIVAMPDKIEVELQEYVGSVFSAVLARDQTTMFGLQFGSSALTLAMSNDSHIIPVSVNGVEDFTGSGTEIFLYEGAIPLNFVTEYPSDPAGTWVIANISAINLTESNSIVPTEYPSMYSGEHYATVGDHSAEFPTPSTLDPTASVTYEIEGFRINGEPFFLEMRQTFSRSFGASDGLNGGAVSLTAADLSVTYDSAGDFLTASNLNSNGTLDITATAFNLIGTLYYRFLLDEVQVQHTTSNVYEYTPKATLGAMPDIIRVEVREDGPTEAIVAQDQITIIGIQQGSDAILISMPNSNHSIVADSEGGVDPASFAGSGTLLEVYEGDVLLTFDSTPPLANSTFAVTLTPTNVTLASPAYTVNTNGSITINDYTAMSQDMASVEVAITGVRDDGVAFGPLYVVQSLTKSKQGTGAEYYYIKPTNGTAIKNGVGTLTVEARRVANGVDALVSSGTIQLYVGSTLVTVANGYAAGSNGYTGVFDSGDITGDVVVTIKDGAGGTPLDTISLVDIADGAAVGYIEASNGIAFTRATDQTTWYPASPAYTDLVATFVRAGATLGSETVRVTRSAAGILTASTTVDHGSITNAVTGSSTQALTVKFTYTDSLGTIVVGETVTTSLAGATGSAGANGVDGLVMILTNEAHIIPCDAAGTPTSFTGSGTDVQIFEGSTELSGTGSTVTNGQWAVDEAASGVTHDSTPDYGVITGARYGVITGMSTDPATITYTVTGKRLNGTNFTISRIMSFAKSIEGDAGLSGKTVNLTVNPQIIRYDTGAAVPTTLTLTAESQGYVTPYYQFAYSTNNGGSYTNISTKATTASRIVPTAGGALPPVENTYIYKVTAYEGNTTNEPSSDTQSASGLKNGINGIRAVIEPNVAVVPINSDGVTPTYYNATYGYIQDSAAATRLFKFKLYDGNTDITSSATLSMPSGAVYGTYYYRHLKTSDLACFLQHLAGGTYSRGDVFLAVDTDDDKWATTSEETFTLRANYNSVNYDVTFTVTKSPAGSDGGAGAASTVADRVIQYFPASGQASAAFKVDNNGSTYRYIGTTNPVLAGTVTTANSETWLPAGGAVADYSVSVSLLFSSGPASAPLGSAINSWLSCSTDQFWYITTASAEKEADLNVKIRHNATNTIVADAFISLQVDSGTPG